jgi:hypothetical protein
MGVAESSSHSLIHTGGPSILAETRIISLTDWQLCLCLSLGLSFGLSLGLSFGLSFGLALGLALALLMQVSTCQCCTKANNNKSFSTTTCCEEEMTIVFKRPESVMARLC